MRSNMMLLMAAAIWGLGFVAQRLGMDHMGPFTFNGLRFVLGALSLLPLLWWKTRVPPTWGACLGGTRPQATPSITWWQRLWQR